METDGRTDGHTHPPFHDLRLPRPGLLTRFSRPPLTALNATRRRPGYSSERPFVLRLLAGLSPACIPARRLSGAGAAEGIRVSRPAELEFHPGCLVTYTSDLWDEITAQPPPPPAREDSECHVLILMSRAPQPVGLIQALFSVLAQVLCFLELSWYLPFLVFSLVLGWINVLYYTRGFQQTGIYSVMIQKVILRDLLRFLLVYFVFLFGFAIALVSLTREGPLPAFFNQTAAEEAKVPYDGFVEASLELFKFTIGMGELEFHKELQFKGFVMFLLLAYVLLTYILLLNMLIALMSETVNSVATDSWSIWKLQRAISVLEMERGYWWCKRKKERSGILLTVGTTPDQKPDERWCFRVEEVNWATWEKELQTLKEEPEGTSEPGKSPTGAAWRRLLSSRPRGETTSEDQVPLRHLSA
ncbi:transient receptor potential cation channel subfamily V member 2 [Gracilinanus agilis]|uniref:transient receptor potential cation channel subfamily V member 2 n=1 Tax=Gracilinanus agilis TaxID=191870 RepID=UPI001CFF3800|nr:transient receptor potential cation channel subfamily V member 2 [Gracilinanus agilis]